MTEINSFINIPLDDYYELKRQADKYKFYAAFIGDPVSVDLIIDALAKYLNNVNVKDIPVTTVISFISMCRAGMKAFENE